jgi:hypothetical protein
MATSRITGTNENISTYGGAGQGRDYTSLATWEAATDNDLVTATQSEVLECYADEPSFNDSVIISGATTNSSYFRIIRPAGTLGTGTWQGHNGTPSGGGVFFLSTASNEIIENQSENNFSVQDLLLRINADTASTIRTVENGGTDGTVIGVIVFDGTSTSGVIEGIRLANQGDCIAVNCLTLRNEGFGFAGDSDSTTDYFYNCTAIDNGSFGFDDTGAGNVVDCKNCLATGNTGGDFDTAAGVSDTNCASGDATATGTGGRINQTFTFKDAVNDDYHLASNDAGALGYGTDLSADAIFAFDDDVDGETRP